MELKSEFEKTYPNLLSLYIKFQLDDKIFQLFQLDDKIFQLFQLDDKIFNFFQLFQLFQHQCQKMKKL